MKEEKLDKEIGKIKLRGITEEMRESYIDYAMSVIVSRALPDVRDGLKPVHRRILYAMLEDGLRHDAKFRKSATVVGSVLGRYHPHGDQAVYDSLVRMAQNFSLRYPLVQGQGNFGSVDSDPPAAQRYTECRLSKIGEETLRDIEKNTVDFIDNYDTTRKEPVVLPSPLPQLLLNGSMGIAVGMATNIPSHNLKEVCESAIYLLEHPEADTEDLFKFIQGPDFPTGGTVFNKEEIIFAYSQGKGAILTRGKAEVIEKEKGRFRIVITEIPYQVDKSSLIQQFANLVQTKKVGGIKDIRDESDKEGMRITIDLQNGSIPQKVLNSLYKFSDLQKTFHLNMLALVDGIQPKVLNLKEVLEYYLLHRQEVVSRRTKFELERAKARAHILEGISKALDKIDAVIATIRKSKDKEDAKKNLIQKFKLTSLQAEAILEIKLHQLARLEKEKIETELAQKLKEIKELGAILKSKEKVKEVIKEELLEEIKIFSDERRTKVVSAGPEKISEIDIVPQEDTIITLTKDGYIKRINPSLYHKQIRGGKGILGMKTAQDDVVCHSLLTKTHDSIFFFTNSGKVFQTKAYEIPEAQRTSRGRGLMNFLEISSKEPILSLLSISKTDKDSDVKYLAMVTKNGIIKRTSLGDFENIRRGGLIAINLRTKDALRGVEKTTGEDEIILTTKKGQAILFSEKEIRHMGRQASGVRGIRLKKQDEVVGMNIIKQKVESAKRKAEESKVKRYLLVVTENGYGKRTDLKEYRKQKRGGIGIRTARVTNKTGDLVKTQIIDQQEDLIVISQKGKVIRTKIGSISKLGRNAQGVRIMRLEPGDKAASVICI